MPGTAQAAAIAVPDDDVGERVCAVVVCTPGTKVELDEVREQLGAMDVARFKLPERLVVLDELPQTKIGKIDKAALRRQVAEKRVGSSQEATWPLARRTRGSSG